MILVHPADLRAYWPKVLTGLCHVRLKTHCDWIAEDVYHAIKAGEAALHVTQHGFMVTTAPRAEFSGEQSLHVWIAYNSGDHDVMDEGLELLRDMARRMGVKRITFGSPRKGWAKRYPLIEATYGVEI